VHASVANWLRDAECIQIALVCATRQHDELLQYMFNKDVAKRCLQSAASLSITSDEWLVLFGAAAPSTASSQLAKVVADSSFVSVTTALQTALRCTVQEATQSKTWARHFSRAACLLSMHVEQHEAFVASCIGNVVRADLRRLEDVRSDIDDEGCDVVLVSQVVQALSHSC
jgi:hypothetical protein